MSRLLNNGVLWTEAEMEILRANYMAIGAKAVKTLLPERSMQAIYNKAEAFGLIRRRFWTEHDLAVMRGNWGVEDIDTIAKRLGRTAESVGAKAKLVGLPVLVPEGWESLVSAVRRTGYAHPTLRRILKWAEVRVIRAYAARRGTRYNQHIVDPFEVDEAVARWHQTETPVTAARARGVSVKSLMSAARECGATISRLPTSVRTSKRMYFRASTEAWDAAYERLMERRGMRRAA